jgi:hypothetical protein
LNWRHFQNFVVSRGAVPSRTALVVFTKLTGLIGGVSSTDADARQAIEENLRQQGIETHGRTKTLRR